MLGSLGFSMSTEEAASLTARVTRGLGSLFIGAGVQTSVQLVVTGVLARLLSPSQFGLMGAAMVVIAFISIIGQSGVGPAIVQRADLSPAHLRAGQTLSLLLSLSSWAALVLAAPWVARFFRMPDLESVVLVVSLILPIAGISRISEALVQREMRFRQLATIGVISYLLGYGVVGILLSLAGVGVWSLVGAQLVQAAVRSSMLLAVRRGTLQLGTLACSETRDLLKFGAGLSLAKLANQLAIQGDNLIVGRMLGADALGQYGRAYQAGVMPASVIGSVIDTVMFPALAGVQKEKPRLVRGFIDALAASAVIAIPAMVLLSVLAPELIVVMFGSQWDAAISPFRILSLALLFRINYKVCDALARATGYVYRQAWRHSVYAVAVIVGALGGQRWGVSGVAAGVLAATFLHYTLMLQLGRVATGARWTDMVLAQCTPLPISLLLGLVAQVTAQGMRNSGAPPLLVLLAVAGLGLVVYLLLFRYSPRVMGRGAILVVSLVRMRYRGLSEQLPGKVR